MKEQPKAWNRCITKHQGHWYIAHWLEGSPLVTLTKSRGMPGEGFVAMESEPYKKRGTMSRRVPVGEVVAFPTVLYKGERVGLEEMDPEACAFRVAFLAGIGYPGKRSAGFMDGWRVLDERDQSLISPFMDPEDPCFELIPGPAVPRLAPPSGAAASAGAHVASGDVCDAARDTCAAWDPSDFPATESAFSIPNGTAELPQPWKRFAARYQGHWYIAYWSEGRPMVALVKSKRMPGEGFTAMEGEPHQGCGLMARRVSAGEVDAFPTVLYMYEKVRVGEMDPEARTLRVTLLSGFFTLSGQRSAALLSEWRVMSEEEEVLESPFMNPTDPRINLIAGLPLRG